jgi:hypothetical protein
MTITVGSGADNFLAFMLGGMDFAKDTPLAEDGLPVFNAEQPLILSEWPELTEAGNEDGRLLRWAEGTVFAVSRLKFSPGTALWRYWTVGKGAAKWMSSPNPWTTLHGLLLKYVGPMAAGLTTNVMLATPAGRALFKQHHGGKKAA